MVNILEDEIMNKIDLTMIKTQIEWDTEKVEQLKGYKTGDWVVVEVHKKNGRKKVKSFRVIKGKWHTKFLTVLTSIFKPGQHIHTGGGVIRNLSALMSNLYRDYAALLGRDDLEQKDIKIIKKEGEEFNKLIRTISTLSSFVANNGEICTNMTNLTTIHEVVSKHLQLIQHLGDLPDTIPTMDKSKYIENAEKIFKLQKEIAKTPTGDSNLKEILDTLKGTIASKLKGVKLEQNLKTIFYEHSTYDDRIENFERYPIHEMLQNACSVRNILTSFEELENSWDARNKKAKNLNLFIKKGLNFIHSFHSLDPKAKPSFEKELADINKKFTEFNFYKKATQEFTKFKEQLERFSTANLDREKLMEFKEKFQSYKKIMEDIQKIKDQIPVENEHKKLLDDHNKLQTIVIDINTKLGKVIKTQLGNLLEKYVGEVDKINKKLEAFDEVRQKTESVRKEDIKKYEVWKLSHQKIVDSIITTPVNPKEDIQIPLSNPYKGKNINNKQLIQTLAALVDFARITDIKPDALKLKKTKLDTRLQKANLTKPTGVSAADFLMSKEVYTRVSGLLPRVRKKINRLPTRFKKIDTQYSNTKKAFETPKAKKITLMKNELVTLNQELLNLQRTFAKKYVKQNELVNQDKLVNLIFYGEVDKIDKETDVKLQTKLEANARTQIKYILKRTSALIQESYLARSKTGEEYRFLLKDIVDDMFKRRKQLEKKINAYNKLENPTFYDMSAADILETLSTYRKRFSLEKKIPDIEDIKNAFPKLSQEKLSLLTTESRKILELSAAYKEKKRLEDNFKRAEGVSEEAKKTTTYWNNLKKALSSLCKAAESNVSGQKKAEKIGLSKDQIELENIDIEKRKQRQIKVEEHIGKLKGLIQGETDMIRAVTIKQMMDSIKTLQT